MEKIIKRMVIETMLTEEVIQANETYVSYLENELEILKRKSENRKQTPNQELNVKIKEDILTILAENSNLTATETMNALKVFNANYETLSNQKVSALLKQLKEENLVIKTIDKKVSRFSLVD